MVQIKKYMSMCISHRKKTEECDICWVTGYSRKTLGCCNKLYCSQCMEIMLCKIKNREKICSRGHIFQCSYCRAPYVKIRSNLQRVFCMIKVGLPDTEYVIPITNKTNLFSDHNMRDAAAAAFDESVATNCVGIYKLIKLLDNTKTIIRSDIDLPFGAVYLTNSEARLLL